MLMFEICFNVCYFGFSKLAFCNWSKKLYQLFFGYAIKNNAWVLFLALYNYNHLPAVSNESEPTVGMPRRASE